MRYLILILCSIIISSCTTPKNAPAPFSKTPNVQVQVLPFHKGWDILPSGAYRFPTGSYILNDKSKIATSIGFTTGLVTSYWSSIGDFAEQAINTGINKSKANPLLDLFDQDASAVLRTTLQPELVEGSSLASVKIRPYGEISISKEGVLRLIYSADATLYDANKSILWERTYAYDAGEDTIKNWQKPHYIESILHDAMVNIGDQIIMDLRPIKVLR